MGLIERIRTEWNSLDRICNSIIDVREGRVKRDNKNEHIILRTDVYGILPNVVSLFYAIRHPIKIIKVSHYIVLD